MEIKGTVIEVLPLEQGVSQSGKDWKKQMVVVETPGQYPKQVALTLFGKALDFCPGIGAVVTAEVDLESRTYNGRWYTEAKCWKMTVDKAAEAPSMIIEQPGEEMPQDELPF